MRREIILVLIIFLMISVVGYAKDKCCEGVIAKGLKLKNEYTIVGPKNLLKDYKAINSDGTVNVVVEVSAGTVDKWKVDTSGVLVHVFIDSKPKIVDYLPYPVNYGMVPNTILSKNIGGDDGAVDVILLGCALPMGSVVNAKVIGMLKLIDNAIRDDKIVAVTLDSQMGKLNSIGDLDREYPGASEILKIWFKNYKKNYKKGEIVNIENYTGANEAMAMVRKASEEFEKVSDKIQQSK